MKRIIGRFIVCVIFCCGLVCLFVFSLGARKEVFASTEETVAGYDGTQYEQIVLDIENALQENGTCQAFLLNI